MSRSIIVLVIILLVTILNRISAQDAISANNAFFPTDSSVHSLKDFFAKGQFTGQVKDYFMATINQGELRDYYTNALGGTLKYETPTFHGLQFALRGRVAYRTINDNINDPDPIVHRSASWERELYDRGAPEKSHNITQIEELYARLYFSKSKLTLGKIDLNDSPLFLSRNGRMNGFYYRGFWGELEEWKNRKIVLGWINGVAIRGRTDWNAISEAIGINNNGFAPNGERSSYKNTTNTKGIGVLSYQQQFGKKLKLQTWNYFFHRITNISWFQLDYQDKHLILGGQLAYQIPLEFQSRLEYINRFMQPDEKGIVLNVKAGIRNKGRGWEISANYLHAFDSGRFLFPREIGRENFYASQPRTWLDGHGLTDIYMLRFIYKPKNENFKNWRFDLRLSRINTPGLDKLEFNKYNIPSFNQITLDVRHRFNGLLKGLNLRFLYVTRFTTDTTDFNPTDIFYRTNYHHFNLISTVEF